MYSEIREFMAGRKGTAPPPPIPKGKRGPNKINGEAKRLVIQALTEVGGKDWLVALAKHEPRSFAQMLTKLIPTEIAAKVESDVVLRLNVNRRLDDEDEKTILEAQSAEAADILLSGRPEIGSYTDATLDRSRVGRDGTLVGTPSEEVLETPGEVPDSPLDRTTLGESARRTLEEPDSEFGNPGPTGEETTYSEAPGSPVESGRGERPQGEEDS